MKSNAQITSVSRKALWVIYLLSALPVLMLLMSAVMKFAKPAFVVEGFAHLGLPEKLAFGLGILELSCTVVYVIPQSAVLGAILLTGYLGGAILTHLRVGEPIFMQASVWRFGAASTCAILDCEHSFLSGLRRGKHPHAGHRLELESTDIGVVKSDARAK